MEVTINGEHPSELKHGLLRNLWKNDPFLSNYRLKDVKQGHLDVSTANGTQPIPKLYNGSGDVIEPEKTTQQATLKH